MLRVRRRGTIRSFALVLLATLSASWLVVPAIAGAGSIAQTQKAIADLSAALSRQEQRSEISSNEYDAGRGQPGLDQHRTSSNSKSRRRKRAAKIKVTHEEARDRRGARLRPRRLKPQIRPLFNQNVTRSDARTVYENEAIGNLNQSKVQYAA